jgi:predicted secreted protein
MRRTRIFFLGLAILFAAPASMFAGDYAALDFIGFSKDGRYLAFEEYGTQDGSGFPYSSIYFVDVDKNTLAAPAVNIRLQSERATEQQARAKAKLAAARIIRRFAIINGNTGQLTVSRMLTDLNVEVFRQGKTQKINFAEIVTSMYRRGDYELTLDLSEIKNKECDIFDQPVYKFELSLNAKDRDSTTVLQKDDRLPKSRSCPIDYSMQYVYLYEDKIAVFLSTYWVGFEGPDMRYTAVTGRFK